MVRRSTNIDGVTDICRYELVILTPLHMREDLGSHTQMELSLQRQ